MVKRYSIVTICLWIFLIFNVQPIFATNIHVVVDGRTVFFPDQLPYIENNSVLVPIRFVSEELGGTVQWEPSSKQSTIIYEGDQIRLTANSSKAIIKSGSIERQVEMETATVLNNNRMMVPVRFIAETMGFSVTWEEADLKISIKSVIPRMPNLDFLEEFKELETEFSDKLSKEDGYQLIENWRDSGLALTSSGEFKDYITSLNLDKYGDTIYFDYDAKGNENISWISIYFSTDKNQRNFFYYDITPDIIQKKSHVIVSREQFQVGKGSPSWDKARYFRVAFQSKDGETFTIKPRTLSTFNAGKAMVTLWFDDGWENSYTNAYQITSKIDPSISGVIPIVPAAIGTDRYLNKEQLKLLKKAGWEIVNHSYSHPYLTELSDDEILYQVQRSFSFISEYDPVGAYHFAVPFSAADERVLEILRENTLSIRYLGETVDPVFFDRYRIGYKEVTNVTEFETVREWIDEAIENKQWIGLMFHRIEDPADDRYSYGTREFEKIIYYLSFMKEDIKTVTVTEAFKEMNLPISTKPK